MGLFDEIDWTKAGSDIFQNPRAGVVVNPNRIVKTPKISNQQDATNNPVDWKINIEHMKSLYPWQQNIIGALERDQNTKDTYILSQPGSGKTGPVIIHWLCNILNINNSQQRQNEVLTQPDQIPQLLWLVPIKALSGNIEFEMQERLTTIFLQVLENLYKFDNVNKRIKILSNYYFTQLLDGFKKYDDRLVDDIMRCIISSGSTQNDMFVSFKYLDHFKNLVGKLVKIYIDRALVGKIEQGINSVESKPKNSEKFFKPICISIYESASAIISKLDRLKLIIFDESQSLQRTDKLPRSEQIGNSVYNLLTHNNSRQAQLVMLSGSESKESAQNLVTYFNTAFGRRFDFKGIHVTPKSAKNPSIFTVVARSGLSSPNTQLQIIKSILSNNGLIQDSTILILLSKKQINDLIDKIAPHEKTIIPKTYKLNYEKHKRVFLPSDVETIVDPGGVAQISNPILRRAVSNNIGFLYRPEIVTTQSINDMKIVQLLFKKKFIKVLLATDAIQEGINVECRNIFIPSILNYKGKVISVDSLAQLINRAGRQKDVTASIYTDPKFVEHINKALSPDLSDFGANPAILPSDFGKKMGVGVRTSINSSLELGDFLIQRLKRLIR
ncbi:MAG: hypothetical protein PHD05_00270 [Sphaerochaetaceae bacterium]|nr:hypothetical protein [Sphaerochaetaceae bacterium]